MKICNKCKIEKDDKEFYRDKSHKDGVASSCKLCHKKMAKIWQQNNKDKAKETQKKWRKNNPNQAKILRQTWQKNHRNEINEDHRNRYKNNPTLYAHYGRKQRYGLTVEIYNNLLQLQNNKCAICNIPLIILDKRNIHVDHNHITNKIRGLLCGQCNKGLGNFKDNIKIINSALEYLKSNN